MANNNAGVPPTEPVLQIDQFSVSLPSGADRQFAIEDISLQVAPREILCIVGESGSGKSVTAHGIMGLLPTGQLEPVGGTIHLLGESLLDATSGRLQQLRGSRMSMIFQEPMTALNPVMTLGRQIEEVLAEHTRISTRERMERTLNLMESVNLPDPPNLYRTYPHQISGGQRQRVMIAMALALEPVLLIADEPTTALDVTTQAQILTLISNIQREHNTGVLFITHDFGVVAEIADRVAVMKDGKIVETGPTKHVLGAPKDAYTRMLIAAVPSFTPRRIPSGATKPIVLATDTLSKTYHTKSFFGRRRTVAAVQKVTIKIRQGETLGVVGESGAGKSTILNLLPRFYDADDGQVTIDGTDVRDATLASLRRNVGIVQQDDGRRMLAGLVGLDRGEGGNDHLVADGKVAGGRTVHADGLRSTRRLDGIGLDAGAIGHVPDIHALIRQDAGGVEKLLVDRHRAFIVKVALGHRAGMQLRFQHVEQHGGSLHLKNHGFHRPLQMGAGCPTVKVNDAPQY